MVASAPQIWDPLGVGTRMAKLAPREQKVLELLAEGLASKEVAYELGLTLETVRSYTKRVYKVLGAHNRAEAVRFGIQQGLLPNPALPAASVPSLSAPSRRFVGRAEQLRMLDQLLDGHRLVSLVGLGGVGKTAMALHCARSRLDSYEHGAVDVSLDSVEDESGLVQALAAALGLALQQPDGDAWAALARDVDPGSRLVILDNMDQLVSFGPRLVRLIEEVPGLVLLVTSRLPLELAEEAVLRIGGLSFPADSDVDLGLCDAVLLLAEEVRRLNPARAITDADRQTLGRIAAAVEGVPLALLLAASWSDVLPVDRIEADLRAATASVLTSDHHHRPAIVGWTA